MFLRHLVGLAKGLKLLTVAECVETAEEAALLRREGVHFLQGYYYGVPSLEPPWAVQSGPKRARRRRGLARTVRPIPSCR